MTANHPTPVILDNEALAEIEATNEVYRIDWRYPNQKERVRALVQTVRAMQGLLAVSHKLLQMADYAAEEYKRQAEAVVAEMQRERDELRERLAETHRWIDRKNAAIETWQQRAGELESLTLDQVEQK